MIENTLTRIADNLDRIADAIQLVAIQQGEAVMLARLQVVERKVEAIADPAPTTAAAAEDPLPPPVTGAELIEKIQQDAKPVTHDDIRSLAKQLIAVRGTKEWKKVLADAGADTVSALKADKLPAVAAAINALLS